MLIACAHKWEPAAVRPSPPTPKGHPTGRPIRKPSCHPPHLTFISFLPDVDLNFDIWFWYICSESAAPYILSSSLAYSSSSPFALTYIYCVLILLPPPHHIYVCTYTQPTPHSHSPLPLPTPHSHSLLPTNCVGGNGNGYKKPSEVPTDINIDQDQGGLTWYDALGRIKYHLATAMRGIGISNKLYNEDGWKCKYTGHGWWVTLIMVWWERAGGVSGGGGVVVYTKSLKFVRVFLPMYIYNL